MNVSFLSNR